ncbi:hypothetical protein HU200_027058 [Digitaria exilis]|uniref:Uncharacterized protein n=1 Tax=Digitaria exilis TaxID=1010633 RepID=A0A835BU80_9POAL|nr:hypothetical protein HU200_027058 [Digitaria exilis]
MLLPGKIIQSSACTDLHCLSQWQCTLDCLLSLFFLFPFFFFLQFLASARRMQTRHEQRTHVGQVRASLAHVDVSGAYRCLEDRSS